MKNNAGFNMRSNRLAFTLAEVLAALVVCSMVLIVILAIYSRAQAGGADILNKLESNRLPREVLQRIAEDLDRVVVSGQDVRIDIENKFQEGMPVAKIEIVRNINDAKDQPQVLEKIVWQSSIDPDSGMLVLYRSHSGIALEDKLLDEQKEPWQRELYVPVCSGLTFFRIEVPQGETIIDRWAGDNLPPAIILTLSFSQPYKTVQGTLDVPEEEKVINTIAVDRTRKPAFQITLPDANDLNDVNQPADANQQADVDRPADANRSSGSSRPGGSNRSSGSSRQPRFSQPGQTQPEDMLQE